MSDTDLVASIEQDGFAVVPNAVSADAVAALIAAVETISGGQGVRRRENIYAVRNLLEVPAVMGLAWSPSVRAWSAHFSAQIVSLCAVFFLTKPLMRTGMLSGIRICPLPFPKKWRSPDLGRGRRRRAWSMFSRRQVF